MSKILDISRVNIQAVINQYFTMKFYLICLRQPLFFVSFQIAFFEFWSSCINFEERFPNFIVV